MSKMKFSNSILATVVLAVATSTASGSEMETLYDGALSRFSPDTRVGGAQHSVAAHCNVDGVTSANNWAGATGHLTLKQNASSAQVTMTMTNGRPDTLFTIWLMLAGKTADGESFGGSPLMKAGATALVPTSLLPEAVAIMKSPTTEWPANGFITDANGNGTVTVDLDFPIIGGAYPFQRFEGFDANDAAYTRDAPKAVPVAITGKSAGAPFTLRLASHCGDNLHNGLVAGAHEAWFNWLAD